MKILQIAASAILALHGLVHLLGVASYTMLAPVKQLPYTTAILNRQLELGATGMAVYGALWAVAAIGFLVSAFGLVSGRHWWRSALLGTAILSLIITAVDLPYPPIGVAVDAVILAALLVGPQVTRRAAGQNGQA